MSQETSQTALESGTNPRLQKNSTSTKWLEICRIFAQRWWKGFLILAPLGWISRFCTPASVSFALNFMALIPEAAVLTIITDELIEISGPMAAILLGVSFGFIFVYVFRNIVEVIISSLGLKSGNDILAMESLLRSAQNFMTDPEARKTAARALPVAYILDLIIYTETVINGPLTCRQDGGSLKELTVYGVAWRFMWREGGRRERQSLAIGPA
ncbi:hypothetical protein B0H10DRAFT_1961242 [Mycena sp. CBHHK59/15]|nr:hypothetical protein B0H10DRAFT_1961242 [Mycena sp. CBHHK59/15]